MKDYIEERAIEIANFIIEEKYRTVYVGGEIISVEMKLYVINPNV